MALISNMDKENIYICLNNALKNEIELMRELLSNLHQEELALLENDKRRFAEVMDERSDHVLSLKELRHKRLAATAELTKFAAALGKKEILPLHEEASCEILSKLDQIIALMERINLQNCRNDALFDQSKQKQEIPLQCSYPHPLHKTVRKTKVATYTQKN